MAEFGYTYVTGNSKKVFKEGDYVQIITKPFLNYFAVVINPNGYGDEIEIQYFKKKFSFYVLNTLDYDSRPYQELMKVYPSGKDGDRYSFSVNNSFISI